MAQHHFVIVYDDVLDTRSIDYETTLARFPDGQMWIEEDDYEGEWVTWAEMTDIERDQARAANTKMKAILESGVEK